MRIRHWAVALIVVVAGFASTAASKPTTTVKRKDPAKAVLRLSDMPAGWAVSPGGGFAMRAACGLDIPSFAASKLVQFDEPNGFEAATSIVARFASVPEAKRDVASERKLTTCDRSAISSEEAKVLKIAAMNLPAMGEETVALLVDYSLDNGGTAKMVRYTWRRGTTVLFFGFITNYVDVDSIVKYARIMDQRYATA